MSNVVKAQVALLDWVLPEMLGFELLGALRERGIELPVVFLTGYSMVQRELQALDRGAVDFVDKFRDRDTGTSVARDYRRSAGALWLHDAGEGAPRGPGLAPFHGAPYGGSGMSV